MKKSTQKKIVCIGGGTGTFVVLKGLKQYPVTITALVTMSDSGGSNKRIRDEFGLLPTSDIRQCFVALSDENGGVGLLRQLFMYRFEKGEGISGMTFGNLFMAALSDILGSQKEAIKKTEQVLRIRGHVVPITFTDTNLFAKYEDGHVVGEEHLIDEPLHDGNLKIVDLFLTPPAQANPDALKAIEEADLIVLGPGDLYTSLIPNLLVNDIASTIISCRAKVVYVVNLMTKYGQTLGFSANDHVKVLERWIGKSIDRCVLNIAPLPKAALTVYAKYGEYPVMDNLSRNSYYMVTEANLVNAQLVTKAKSDTLIRSLIRHDSDKLAKTIINILE